MNNDTLVTDDDVFGLVWGYFCREDADLNDYHAGVEFSLYGDSTVYRKVEIRLYDRGDLQSQNCTAIYGPYACSSYSWVEKNKLYINATPSALNSMSYVLGQGIAHELQHVCWRANGIRADPLPWGYNSCNETMSTLAEYFVDSWRAPNDQSYDASFLRGEPCDQNSKYQTEKAWAIYLYETFKGIGADPADDAVHAWIRSATEAEFRMTLPGLADVLWNPAYAWVGGGDAADRLDRVYANFLVAKFCNAPAFAPNSRFGATGFNSQQDLHFFTDNCTVYPGCSATDTVDAQPMIPVDCPGFNGYANCQNLACWNVRVLLPEHEVTDLHENTMTNVSGIYEDGDAPLPTGDGDLSTDYIDVFTYGTDYIIFHAAEYYNDGEEHEFEIRVEGNSRTNYPETKRMKPIGWVMGYCCDEGDLQVNPQNLVFVEPLVFSPSTTLGEFVTARPVIVTDFGRSIKAVVLAVGGTSVYPSKEPTNAFIYEYDFGVYTPGGYTRNWEGDVFLLGDVTVPSGGTLAINAGTNVRVFPQDLAATGVDQGLIELNVEGTLVADGTAAAPIVVKSWTEASDEDWFGFYFDNASGGGTFDHCVISNAIYGFDSYVPLTVTNTEISKCFYGVFASAGALVQNSTLTDFKWHGIYLWAGGTSTVRNSIIDGADYYGLVKQTGTSVVVRNSQFKNCDVGLWGSGSGSVDVDSACYFYSNGNGIRFSNAGSSSTIRAGGITYNTLDAIVCDISSHPLIEANIFANNGGGIYCSNNSSPTIKANQIQSSGNAVTATTGANPDVGHYPSSGNNSIAHTGMYVVNYTTNSLYAQNTCWDVDTSPCRPPTNKFVGNVNRTNAICCEFPAYEGGEGDPPGPVAPFEPRSANTTGLVAIVPNPFNPTTTIHYSLASQTLVELNIYDVAGRLVEELIRGTQSAGPHAAVWNGTDRQGSPVASGVYFVRMASTGQVFTKKMVLLK